MVECQCGKGLDVKKYSLLRIISCDRFYDFRGQLCRKYNGEIVLEAVIQLTPTDADEIQRNFDAADKRRQPQHNIRQPNCGSVFRNPENDYAGRLIEQLGAKGRSFGSAQVSLDHANFVVNTGGATARDTCILIRSVQADIWDRFAVRLEPEAILLGEF